MIDWTHAGAGSGTVSGSGEISSATVSDLMARFRRGDRRAVDELFQIFYPQLRQLAAVKMRREDSQHSWQPSQLVHELYLQLIRVKSLPGGAQADRSEQEHFLKFAAHVMRHLLIDHSRLLIKRSTKIDIANFEIVEEETGTVSLLEIDSLLENLAAIHPRLRSIVEMKVFEGLPVEEIGQRLDVAPRTVARNWAFARQWLRESMHVG